MAWGDPSDYWWLHQEKDNALPAMQFGAQLRQRVVENVLKQREMELQSQRTGIQIQEYFSKKELQNTILEGNAALAQAASKFSDASDPNYLKAIWEIGAKYPDQVNTPHFDGLLKRHETSVLAKSRLAELEELRLSREQIASAALAERTAKREGAEAFNAEKLAIWQQRADTGQMDAESRAEYRDFQKENVGLTHEETARRLAVMESNAATRQQRLNDKIQNLSPEKRDLLKRDMDRLDARAEANEFVKRMPWGTKNIKYGPKYDEERKKLLESYGISSGASGEQPLAAPLQKFRFDPATGKLEPIK